MSDAVSLAFSTTESARPRVSESARAFAVASARDARPPRRDRRRGLATEQPPPDLHHPVAIQPGAGHGRR